MGKFNQYLGKTELTVDGQKLELDVKLKDMKKIMTASKGSEITEESIETIANVFKEVMKRSYPSEPAEEIDAFVEKKLTEFITEFSIAMGWTTRKQLKESFREAGVKQSGKKGKVLPKS